MIPYAEGLLAAYLRNHPDVSIITGNRVATQLPSKFGSPYIKVLQLDAPDRSAGMEHLIDHLVQFDCYAGEGEGGSVEASLLARTVRAALVELRGSTVDGVVVTDVRFTGMPRLPDTDFKPARERVVLSAEIDMHPATGGS